MASCSLGTTLISQLGLPLMFLISQMVSQIFVLHATSTVILVWAATVFHWVSCNANPASVSHCRMEFTSRLGFYFLLSNLQPWLQWHKHPLISILFSFSREWIPFLLNFSWMQLAILCMFFPFCTIFIWWTVNHPLVLSRNIISIKSLSLPPNWN